MYWVCMWRGNRNAPAKTRGEGRQRTAPGSRSLKSHLHLLLLGGMAEEPDWRALAAAFAPGDVLRFRRGAYSHLALSAGRGRVLHLWSPSTAGAFRVRLDTLRAVMRRPGGGFFDAPERATAELDARMRSDHALEPLEGEEVVRRARGRLGEAPRYDCVSDNCEHFVTWARYGRRASPQVERHAGDVLSAAMLGAAVGGAAGLVVGALISLFTKADALSASVGTTASMGAAALGTYAPDEEDVSEDEGDRLSSLSDSDSENEIALHSTERERLWAGVAANTAAARADSEQGRQSAADMTSWIEGRRHESVAASARKYGDDRHEALASRLAEDGLQCGYVSQVASRQTPMLWL